MSENENAFRKVVADLRIDAEPNPVHRERLRRQMLQTFEQAGGRGLSDRRTVARSSGRTVRPSDGHTVGPSDRITVPP